MVRSYLSSEVGRWKIQEREEEGIEGKERERRGRDKNERDNEGGIEQREAMAVGGCVTCVGALASGGRWQMACVE